ncbi:MAG: Flp family type IVb pilin [Dehalococcoidia bacterium]
MIEELQKFLRDEAGPELVEWAVVTIVLLAATVLVLREIGVELERIFRDILDELRGIP